MGRALPRSTPATSGGSIGFPRYKLAVVVRSGGGGGVEEGCKVMIQLGCHLLENSHHCNASEQGEPRPYSSILSGKPQQRCGLASPCPVWMKLFLSGRLMS